MFSVPSSIHHRLLEIPLSHSSSTISRPPSFLDLIGIETLRMAAVDVSLMPVIQRLCGDAVVADVSFHKHLVIQQVEDGRDDANHQHDGHGGPPSHAPVGTIIGVLPRRRFVAELCRLRL